LKNPNILKNVVLQNMLVSLDMLKRFSYVKENMARLIAHGYAILEPGYGELACRIEGQGRLPEGQEIAEEIESLFSPKNL